MTCEATDVFDGVSGGRLLSRWVAGWLFMSVLEAACDKMYDLKRKG